MNGESATGAKQSLAVCVFIYLQSEMYKHFIETTRGKESEKFSLKELV